MQKGERHQQVDLPYPGFWFCRCQRDPRHTQQVLAKRLLICVLQLLLDVSVNRTSINVSLFHLLFFFPPLPVNNLCSNPCMLNNYLIFDPYMFNYYLFPTPVCSISLLSPTILKRSDTFWFISTNVTAKQTIFFTADFTRFNWT